MDEADRQERISEMPVTEVQSALRELQIAMDRGSALLARSIGLSVNEMSSLDVVASAETGRIVGPADIARQLHVSTAAATGLVDRLVSRGHVERHPHQGDRRRLALRHTDHAEKAIGVALSPLLDRLSDVEARMSDEERAVVLRFLRDITEVWRTLHDRPSRVDAGDHPATDD